jgi:putative cell wall binding repeat protein
MGARTRRRAYCLDAMRLPKAPSLRRRSASPDPGQAPPPPPAAGPPRVRRRPLRALGRGLARVAGAPVGLVRRITVPAPLRTPTSAVLLAVIVALLLVVILSGGGSGLGLSGSGDAGAIVDGLPLLATKNTTRVAGSSPAAIAAGVALAVYPGGIERPKTVAIADAGNWEAALAATALMSPPLRAPLLLSSGGGLPGATQSALAQLTPTHVVRVGNAAASGTPASSTQITGANVYALAANVAAYVAKARGTAADNRVMIVSVDAPQYAMAAAAWSAKSGDPILFVTKNNVPPETRDAIGRLQQPRIFVFGPGAVVGRPAIQQLLKLGTVRRIGGADPVDTAVAFARYQNGAFGWGPVRPGRGLVIASDGDPVVAAAAAALSSSGTYGPLLLLDPAATQLPPAVVQYLLDNQPGYATDPARGVYNHAWIIGDSATISLAVQARIDSDLEIVPVSGSNPSG